MNFELNDQQKELYKASLNFSSSVVDFKADTRISDHIFDRELWEEVARFGYGSLTIPTQDGGSGLSMLDAIIMVEALGKGTRDLGLAFSICSHLFASVMPIVKFGSSSLKEKYMDDFINGRLIVANAASEPNAGSDIYSMQSTAIPVEGGYRLNGIKCFVTNAPIADLFLVYAKTNPKHGFMGVTPFLIPRKTKGLTVGIEKEKDSLSTCPWSEVYFDDVFIPNEQRIGGEGSGWAVFNESMVWEKGCLFAIYLGAMDRLFSNVCDHVKTRKQFGKAISKFQSVSNKIVDMKINQDCSRLLLYKAGWLYDEGKDFEMEIAMSKLVTSESAVQCALDCIQLFGGSAIEKDMGLIQTLLDTIPSRIFSGTNDIQRQIISSKLFL